MGGMGEKVNPHGQRVGVIRPWNHGLVDEFDEKVAKCKDERDRLLKKTDDYFEKQRIEKIYLKRIELFRQKQFDKYGKTYKDCEELKYKIISKISGYDAECDIVKGIYAKHIELLNQKQNKKNGNGSDMAQPNL